MIVSLWGSLCNSLKSQSVDYTLSIKNLPSYCSSHHECTADFQIPRLMSVQFSHSVLSNSLWSHGLQHARRPYRQLPELTWTHVHCVGDAIQPSLPLSSPSPLAFNLSQHQGLFKWVSSSRQVAKVLEFQLRHQSFQWIFWTDLL